MDTELELTEAFDNHKEYMNLEKFLKFAEQYLEGGVENGAQLIDQVGRGMFVLFRLCGRVTGGIFFFSNFFSPKKYVSSLYTCDTICVSCYMWLCVCCKEAALRKKNEEKKSSRRQKKHVCVPLYL